MIKYPTKVTLHTGAKTTNAYGEVITTKSNPRSTGARVSTSSFKDILGSGQTVDTAKLWIFVRRNTVTKTVAVNDIITIPGVNSEDYLVIGIDEKHSQRGELLFLVDKIEGGVS